MEQSNPYLVAQYVAYLTVSIAVTFGVGRTLFKHGAAFLTDTFVGKEKLAEAVNHLLLVGFYLINCGWVVLSLKTSEPAYNAQQVLENLAGKVGSVLVVLGIMHFANLYVFNRMRRRAMSDRQPPPVMPREWVPSTAAQRVP